MQHNSTYGPIMITLTPKLTVPCDHVFFALCVLCVRELPRQASCGPLYLSKVLERDWCLLKPCRPARWPLMGTVLILSKCTRLLLWTSREREERKSRAKKGSRREKDKKRGKECEKNWKTDQQEPESKISKKAEYSSGREGFISADLMSSIWVRDMC